MPSLPWPSMLMTLMWAESTSKVARRVPSGFGEAPPLLWLPMITPLSTSWCVPPCMPTVQMGCAMGFARIARAAARLFPTSTFASSAAAVTYLEIVSEQTQFMSIPVCCPLLSKLFFRYPNKAHFLTWNKKYFDFMGKTQPTSIRFFFESFMTQSLTYGTFPTLYAFRYV